MEKLLVERGGQFMVRKSFYKNIKPIPKHLTLQISIKGWQQTHLGWLGLVCCHRSRKEEQHWGTYKESILTRLTLNEGKFTSFPQRCWQRVHASTTWWAGWLRLYILFKPFVTKIKYKTNQVPNIANWLNSRPDTVLWTQTTGQSNVDWQK